MLRFSNKLFTLKRCDFQLLNVGNMSSSKVDLLIPDWSVALIGECRQCSTPGMDASKLCDRG